MSYKVLARRWRPQKFANLVGQDVVVRTLQNALKQQKIGHAYLFCGIRGVGKTTLARLMAMALNCESPTTDAEPCGTCHTCQAIGNGSTLDILEMDAASHTGVDDIRELMDSVRYPPVNLRHKVYIIDEAHMLSKSAFNALLKTLEEPPQHIVFILATTEAEKLPITVRSRCQRFDLRCLSIKEICDHLRTVLQHENIDNQESALFEIARAAQGSVRDALSLTERVMAFSGHIHLEDVRQSIGLLADEYRCRLSNHIFQGKAADAVLCLRDIASQGHSLTTSLHSLSELWHQLACVMVSPELLEIEVDTQTQQWLEQWKVNWTYSQLDMRYQVLIHGIKDLHLVDERCGTEMLVMRLAGLQLLDTINSEKTTNTDLKKTKEPTVKSTKQGIVKEKSTPTQNDVKATKQAQPKVILPQPDAPLPPPHHWEEALQAYSSIRPGIAAQLEQVSYDDDGQTVHLALPSHLQRLIGADERKKFETWFKRPIQWQANHQKKVDSVSQQRNKRIKKQEEQRYREAEENPHIQHILQTLGGHIVEVHPARKEH